MLLKKLLCKWKGESSRITCTRELKFLKIAKVHKKGVSIMHIPKKVAITYMEDVFHPRALENTFMK